MALAQPLLHDSPSTKQFSTDKQPLLDTPERERHPQLPPPHSGLNWKSVPKLGLALILAIFYVGFCFIVQYRVVPIGGSGVLGLPFAHFSTESGITTVAILIVYVALWPIKSVLDEIKSEEFFRLLRAHPNGVPLDSVNAVSAPTNGAFNIFLASIRRHCSPLLTSTLAITLVITATSSLAPASLNAHSIWIDVDDPNFRIGTINNTQERIVNNGGQLYEEAAAMSWVENALNFTNAYYKVASSEDDLLGTDGDPFGYIVPFPPGYNTAMRAHWTTDIVVLNPSCSWQSTNITGIIDVSTGTKVTVDQGPELMYWNVALLPETNPSFVLSVYSYVFVSIPSNPPTFVVATPQTTEDPPTVDGSVVFIITQVPAQAYDAMNMSGLPTLQFSNGNVLAFLRCFPHPSIQTRQVRTTGNGILTLGQTQQRQGNLDIDQITSLLSRILVQLPSASGPGLGYANSAAMMIKLLFGENFKGFGPGSTPPAPLANITAVYKVVIQSAMKTFLSGVIGTSNVPGGFAVEQLAFSSSLGHVILSAILFALLVIALVAAQYRKGRDAFTLIHVAAALEGSDVPKECLQMRQLSGKGDEKMVQLVPNDNTGVEMIVLTQSEKDESVSL